MIERKNKKQDAENNNHMTIRIMGFREKLG